MFIFLTIGLGFFVFLKKIDHFPSISSFSFSFIFFISTSMITMDPRREECMLNKFRQIMTFFCLAFYLFYHYFFLQKVI